MSMKGTKHTYQPIGTGGDVGGARIGVAFKPEGTRPGAIMVSAMVVGAGVATFDGPFRWRIEAVGDEGVHRSLIIHRIHTRTGRTNREGWYPSSQLGRRADFKKIADRPGKSRARYLVPGLLEVFPEKDGKLEVRLDLSVVRVDRTVRKTVTFTFDPSVKSQNEFIFIPKEIAEGVGKPIDEMEDPMWD